MPPPTQDGEEWGPPVILIEEVWSRWGDLRFDFEEDYLAFKGNGESRNVAVDESTPKAPGSDQVPCLEFSLETQGSMRMEWAGL